VERAWRGCLESLPYYVTRHWGCELLQELSRCKMKSLVAKISLLSATFLIVGVAYAQPRHLRDLSNDTPATANDSRESGVAPAGVSTPHCSLKVLTRLYCVPSHRVCAKPKALPDKGVPNGTRALPAVGIPVLVVWHGVGVVGAENGVGELGTTTRGVKLIRGANALGVSATDGGLRPPLPISVDPSGIPVRPTGDPEPMPPGNGAAGAIGPSKELPPVEAQAPDADPVIPPPSNAAVDVDVPAVDTPEPKDVPAIELPPVPEYVPAVELAPVPKADACGIEAPTPEQVVPVTPVGAVGDTPDVSGLTPGDASSVAPSGVPVGPTSGAAPIPRGDVISSGTVSGTVSGELLMSPTCAKAEPQSTSAAARTAAVVAIIKRLIIGSTRNRTGGGRPAESHFTRRSRRAPGPSLCADCRDSCNPAPIGGPGARHCIGALQRQFFLDD
jgi:hypothetical protein